LRPWGRERDRAKGCEDFVDALAEDLGLEVFAFQVFGSEDLRPAIMPSHGALHLVLSIEESRLTRRYLSRFALHLQSRFL
jgi:hypothetical protein